MLAALPTFKLINETSPENTCRCQPHRRPDTSRLHWHRRATTGAAPEFHALVFLCFFKENVLRHEARAQSGVLPASDKCCVACRLALQRAWTMPTSRPRKKARSAKKAAGDSAKAKPVETIGKNGSSVGKPQLSAELIARVSTYVPLFRLGIDIDNVFKLLYDDLHNLCLATGPQTSRLIKQNFLKKNLHYIEQCQLLFGPMGAE